MRAAERRALRAVTADALTTLSRGQSGGPVSDEAYAVALAALHGARAHRRALYGQSTRRSA